MIDQHASSLACLIENIETIFGQLRGNGGCGSLSFGVGTFFCGKNGLNSMVMS